MTHVSSLIIGAGQAGLALSKCLTDRAVPHVVLERGRIGERWRSERWESLRLLTPNWQSRLPGFRYDGPDPDGYMTMAEVSTYLERYAASFGAPVQSGAAVESVTRDGDSFIVAAGSGRWRAKTVVVATGYSDVPFVPGVASRFPDGIAHIVPNEYRRPSQLAEGGVLVVGASATGIQLADEIHRSGRRVTLAVGHHTRMPRVYRGRDVLWWLDRMGVFDETVDQVYDVEVSRDQPSFQLIGHPDRVTLDLAVLAGRGVRLVGRLKDLSGRPGFDHGRRRHQTGDPAAPHRRVHRARGHRRRSAAAVRGAVLALHRFRHQPPPGWPRHQDRAVGDGLSAQLSVAEGAGARRTR
jgi:putative flavoprotein involved in K+ transport